MNIESIKEKEKKVELFRSRYVDDYLREINPLLAEDVHTFARYFNNNGKIVTAVLPDVNFCIIVKTIILFGSSCVSREEKQTRYRCIGIKGIITNESSHLYRMDKLYSEKWIKKGEEIKGVIRGFKPCDTQTKRLGETHTN